MRLGIYIGSFNPPHKGHKDVIDYLINNNYVDKVLVVPSMNYWNKTNLVDIKDRINMLKFYENKNIKVDTKHNKYKYTYKLIDTLKKQYPLDTLYLIIGADNIINFNKWKNYKKLLKYKIIVMNRNNININKYIKQYNSNNFIIINDYKNIEISSSEIRNNLNSKYLDKNIKKYIIDNNLY